MDILYYIGSGSRHNNDELRYSLRSIEKYCKDVGRVFIVGNKPNFIINCELIWVDDKFEWWKNAFEKTKAAIYGGISDEFLLFNDDFYMLRPFEAATYPFYHKGDIPSQPVNDYQKVIVNTRRVLEQSGKPFKHYGVHCPMRIEKEKYLSLEKYFNTPVSARCLYGNLFCKGVKTQDNKGTEIKNSKQKCFSSADWAGEEMFEKLKLLFPKPSKWEKDNV